MDRIVILGATSAIAEAYARLRAKEGATLMLVGRDSPHLESIANDLKLRGALEAYIAVEDLADTRDASSRWQAILDRLGDPDEVFLAYAILGDQRKAETDVDHALEILLTNYVSAAVWLGLAAETLEKKAGARIVALSSVAGDRGRASNYYYGSTKAALNTFLEGLAHRLIPGGVVVVTVKPGFVRTPMTSHLATQGLLWSTPERVASAIHRAVRRRTRTVYAPSFWRLVMLIIRSLPQGLFYRTPL